MSTKAKTRRKVRDDYLDLVKAFPLKPIRSEREHDAALSVLDKLAVREEGSLTTGESDYLDTLTLIVESYQQSHHKIDLSGVTPARVLRHLMDANDLKSSDIAPLLGGKSRVSEILSGARTPSKAHALALARRFNVDVGLFF